MTLKIESQNETEEEVIYITEHRKKEVNFEINKDDEIYDLQVAIFYKEEEYKYKELESIEVNSKSVYGSEFNEEPDNVYCELEIGIRENIKDHFANFNDKDIIKLVEDIVNRIEKIIEDDGIKI